MTEPIIQQDSTDTLVVPVPPAMALGARGVLTAATIRVRTPSSAMPDEDGAEAATVDPVDTTVAADTEAGSETVALDDASDVTPGRPLALFLDDVAVASAPVSLGRITTWTAFASTVQQHPVATSFDDIIADTEPDPIQGAHGVQLAHTFEAGKAVTLTFRCLPGDTDHDWIAIAAHDGGSVGVGQYFDVVNAALGSALGTAPDDATVETDENGDVICAITFTPQAGAQGTVTIAVSAADGGAADVQGDGENASVRIAEVFAQTVADGGGQVRQLIVTPVAVDGDTVRLAEPLPVGVDAGAAVRGWSVTHPLTAAETEGKGRGLAVVRATIGGVIYEFPFRFRVEPHAARYTLTPERLLMVYPDLASWKAPYDGDLQKAIHAAWTDLVFVDLQRRGIHPERVHAQDLVEVAHRAAVRLHLLRLSANADIAEIEEAGAFYTDRLDAIVEGKRWEYDAANTLAVPDDEEPDPTGSFIGFGR